MIIETLRKSKIFSPLSEEERETVSNLFEQIECKSNEYIFMENDPPEWIYLASQGKIKMVKHSQEGKDVILEIKVPGEIFCCAAVLGNKPYPESAQAMEPASIIRISRKNLLKLLDEYPLLNLEIARYTSDRIKDAHEMLQNIALERVYRRIAALLLKLAEKAGIEESGYIRIDVPLSRQEIADMVGTTIETSIRSLSKFQKDGIVKTSGNRILVKIDSLKNILKL